MTKHPEQSKAILQDLLTKLEDHPSHNQDAILLKERIHSLRDYLVGGMPAEYDIELPLAKETADALEGDRYGDIKDLMKRLE